MKTASIVAALALFILFPAVVTAQTPPDESQSSQDASALVEKMLDAEKQLTIAGDEITTLYRPERTFTATQSVERIGNWDLRLEYHSPEQVNGDIYVDNGHIAWHYIPAANRLEVGVSSLERLRTESDTIREKLEDHELAAQIVGRDSVAGQTVDIVQIGTDNSWGEHKYWIDPTNGAQLKIQTFGAFGQMISETYFTKVTYNAKISRSDFGPPKVDDTVQAVPMIPRGSQTINGIPSSVQCGFIPLTPSYLPSGFNLQSSTIMPINGEKMLGLTYQNALVTLSIFELPIIVSPGHQEPSNDYKLLRQGVLAARFNSYRYIVISTLPQDVMQQVVQSMH